VPALRRAVALLRESGEPLDLARALAFYGLNLARTGAPEEGLEALQESRRMLSAGAQPKSFALCLTNLGIAHTVAGQYEAARARLDEALAAGERSHADFWAWRAHIYKAEVQFAEGRIDAAIAGAREVIALARAARRTGLLGHALCNLAGYLIAHDEIDAASAALREGLPLAEDSELDTVLIAGGMQHLAAIAARQERFERAAQFIGYAHAFFSKEFAGRSPAKLMIEAGILRQLSAVLAPQRLEAMMDRGARWSEDEAMPAALEA
jgi:ATP/maltotriose-dependent transcriptional regulator MalT